MLKVNWTDINHNSDGWINKKDLRGLSEIFKLANITLTSDKKNELLHELYKNGYIYFGKQIDKCSKRHCFHETRCYRI